MVMARSFLGIQFVDFFNIPKERRIQTLCVCQWTLTFLFLGPLCGIFFIFSCLTPFIFIPLLYLLWFIYDYKSPAQGGRRCGWVQNWKIWQYFRDYFPVQLVKTTDLDPSKNYIFLYHPHGIMAYGAFLNFCTSATGFKKLYPGIQPTLLSLNYQFYFPINREYAMALGICSCSRESMEWLLTKEGTGNAPVLVVGGATEALEARPGSFSLTLSNRKGFTRLALQHGAELVPVFGFGENDLYDQMANPSGSLLRRFQTTMTKLFSFSPPIFHGRGIFNYNFGIFPYRRPLNVVVGSPLKVVKRSNPTTEEINELHERYIKHLIDMFESEKMKYGVSESQHLNII